MAQITIQTNILLLTLGFLPSIVWLVLFLTLDPRPEPKYLILRVFFLGIIIAPLVILLEAIAKNVSSRDFLPQAVTFILLAAFVEEGMKYWAVKVSVVSKPDFDEPHDAIIYMISAALGFAAMENILNAFKMYPQGLASTLSIISLRFTGATLLHALSSGIAGYFLGLAWFFYHFKRRIVTFGLFLAILFHFTFNSLVYSSPETALGANTLLLLGMMIFLFMLFDRLKQRGKQVIKSLST